MHTLEVGGRPDALPCRWDEFDKALELCGGVTGGGEWGCVCEYIPLCLCLCLGVELTGVVDADMWGVSGLGRTVTAFGSQAAEEVGKVWGKSGLFSVQFDTHPYFRKKSRLPMSRSTAPAFQSLLWPTTSLGKVSLGTTSPKTDVSALKLEGLDAVPRRWWKGSGSWRAYLVRWSYLPSIREN